MDNNWTVEPCEDVWEYSPPRAFVEEKFRVFALNVGVHNRQVMPAPGPDDEFDFRPRWWRAPDSEWE